MTDILTAEAKPSAKFEFFTDVLKAGGGDGEPMTLSGVASSTVEDLHGDRIERSALRDMEQQIANGLTIFLNHKYQVPEDVAGFAQSAKVTKRGADPEGNGIWDLDIDLTINDENPRAVEAWKGINRKKWKAGLSIGANIPQGGYETDRKTGAKTIKRIQLLETSIVGIPANQRSWIAKALEVLPDDDEVVLDEAIVKAEELEAAPPADDRDVDPELQDACPSCGKEEDDEGCDDPYHKSAAEQTSPDQPDEETTQDDSAPEAVSSDPGPEESGDAADPSEVAPLEGDPDPTSVLESLPGIGEEVTLTHLQTALEVGTALASQIVGLRRELADAEKAKSEAERERDETTRKMQTLIGEVSEIVLAVGNMPLGRKAHLRGAEAKLDHLKGVYGADFMKMLEKTSD